ncbi:MAG: DUF4159 domain-containing protein [Chloroflexi bacterium]|nr:DUF4159 domain-containing protein [Chloroflexota bacterium]
MRKLTLVSTIFLLVSFVILEDAWAQETHSFTIARIKYDGGGDWYSDPESLPELLEFVRRETLIDVAPREEVVELSSDNLFSYPYIYLTGHGNIRIDESESLRLCRPSALILMRPVLIELQTRLYD